MLAPELLRLQRLLQLRLPAAEELPDASQGRLAPVLASRELSERTLAPPLAMLSTCLAPGSVSITSSKLSVELGEGVWLGFEWI